LIDIVARGVALCRIVGGDPLVVPNESRTSKQARVFLCERPSHVHSRHDFVAGRLTHRVAPRWIHDHLPRHSVLTRQESIQDFDGCPFPALLGQGRRYPRVLLALGAAHNSLIGAGMWRPEPGASKNIRDAIVADPKCWQRITSGSDFRSSCGMAGESLKRPPVGYDPNHPLIEALKRKDFAISSPLDDRDVCRPEFMSVVVNAFCTAAPFVQFLAEAVGLP
jgi:hypothetical protein